MRIGNVVQKNLHHFFPVLRQWVQLALPVTVVVLSPLLVKGAWPNNNKRNEYYRNTLHHFTACAMRTCSSSIPPDDVPVVMVELAADVALVVTVVVLSPLAVEDVLPI